MALLQRLRLSSNYLLVNLDDPSVFNMPIDPNNLNRLMPSLQILDLSYCSIQTINRNGFSILKYFPNLVFLNLMGNRIKNIYENPFVPFTPFLQYLNLEANLIECKLDIRWLKYYLIRNKIKILSISSNGTQARTPYYPTCFNALLRTNESIITLDDGLFYTDIYLSTTLSQTAPKVPVLLNVKTGNTIDLDCQQYSVPPASLWWSFNDRVLSRTVTTDSPYQFLENFNETYSPYNKTSILRIKNIYSQLAGNYSCSAFYLNVDTSSCLNVSTIQFIVNVAGGGGGGGDTSSGMLAAWQIALIVIGAILGFLLLCLLFFCCIYCCCYRLGLCCFKSSNSSTTSSSSSSSNLYNKNKYGTRKSINSASSTVGFTAKNKSISDFEESASGFKVI
jgi:hypothetical protein